ncbi:MAG: vitamin K epoxide reductase family protein [Desulfatitalea sp.]
MLKRAIFPAAIILLSWIGLLSAFALTEEFYYADLPNQGKDGPAILQPISAQACGDQNSFFSCTNVSKSRYAKLFGFPLAIYGLFFYLVTFFAAGAFGFTARALAKPAAVLLFWITLAGLIADVVLLIISLAYVKALCPLCVLTYTVNLLLFGSSLALLIRSRYNPFRPFRAAAPSDLPANRSALLLAGLAVALIVTAAAGITRDANAYLIRNKTQYILKYNASELRRTVDLFAQQAVEDIDPSALHVHGDPAAPVTIIEFSDFLCPYCAYTTDILNQLAAANPGRVHIRFMNFPLDITCNRFMRNPMHKGACDLALGAICAAEQGLLDAYQHAAFGLHLNNPTPEDLKNVVALSGVSEPEFVQCMGKPETLATLQRQIEQTHQYGINSTPTVFINKKRVQGRLSLEALQKIVDMETQATERQQP